MSDPRVMLDEIAQRLRAALDPSGFQFNVDADAKGHGVLAIGFFARPPFRIGLMVRNDTLEVQYEWAAAISGHQDLVRALGGQSRTSLRWDSEHHRLVPKRSWFRKSPGNIIDALILDLANIIVPALDGDAGAVGRVIEGIHAENQSRHGSDRTIFRDRPCRHCGALLNLKEGSGIQQPQDEPWHMQCATCGEDLTPDDVRP